MKKKIVSWLLIATMTLSLVACGGSEEPAEEITQTEETTEESESIEVDENLLTVEITIPASLSEDQSTELTDEQKEMGIKEITKNEDGSITMKMTKAAHKKVLEDFKGAIQETIDETVADKENYPSIESITFNDDVTEFTITADPTYTDGMEGFIALAFYIEGNMYQAFNGVPEEEIHTIVTVVDNNTGEVIESADSADLNE